MAVICLVKPVKHENTLFIMDEHALAEDFGQFTATGAMKVAMLLGRR